jgi:hypothetical protein
MDLHRHKWPYHLCIDNRCHCGLRAIVDIHARRIAIKPVVEQLGSRLDGASCVKEVDSVGASAGGLVSQASGRSTEDGPSGEGQASAGSGSGSRRGVQRHFMINQHILFLYRFHDIKSFYHKILATTATLPAILATLPATWPILRMGWMILLKENRFSSGANADAEKLNEVIKSVVDSVSKQVMI